MMALLFNEEKLMEAYDKELLDEGRAEGRAEGKAEAIVGHLTALMHNMNLTLEQAMTALSVPPHEQDLYRQLINV